MISLQHYSQLEAWKVNHKIVIEIYILTKRYPKDEQYGIIPQMRRAASSVTANIAEGWGRYHYQDKLRFYYQARGSNSEVENFLILSKDLGYISIPEFERMHDLLSQGGRVLNGFIRSVEKAKKSKRATGH